MRDKDNQNPTVYLHTTPRDREKTMLELDNDVQDPFDEREIFDLIRDINDPEHPLTLEDLNVVSENHITIDNSSNTIKVMFTPTIPHCSMATLIGLAIRVRLLRVLPPRFKVEVQISPGTHQSEKAVNKQLLDKERVAAALENQSLIGVVNQCLTAKESAYGSTSWTILSTSVCLLEFWFVLEVNYCMVGGLVSKLALVGFFLQKNRSKPMLFIPYL